MSDKHCTICGIYGVVKGAHKECYEAEIQSLRDEVERLEGEQTKVNGFYDEKYEAYELLEAQNAKYVEALERARLCIPSTYILIHKEIKQALTDEGESK